MLIRLAEAISDLVAVLDADLRLLYINSAGRALLGLAAEAEPENLLETLLAELTGTEQAQAVATARAGGRWERHLHLRGASTCQSTPSRLTAASFTT